MSFFPLFRGFLLIFLALPLLATETNLAIQEALHLGPLPAHRSGKLLKPGTYRPFVARIYREGLPKPGQTLPFKGSHRTWKKAKLAQLPQQAEGVQVLAITMRVESFASGSFHGSVPFLMFLNGSPHTAKASTESELQLKPGSHRLLFLIGPDAKAPPKLEWRAKGGRVAFHAQAKELVNAKQLYHATTATGLSVAPDGSQAAITYKGYDEGDKSWTQTVELLDTRTGHTLRR